MINCSCEKVCNEWSNRDLFTFEELKWRSHDGTSRRYNWGWQLSFYYGEVEGSTWSSFNIAITISSLFHLLTDDPTNTTTLWSTCFPSPWPHHNLYDPFHSSYLSQVEPGYIRFKFRLRHGMGLDIHKLCHWTHQGKDKAVCIVWIQSRLKTRGRT